MPTEWAALTIPDATGGEDERDVFVVHQFLRARQGDLLQAAHQSLRGTGFFGGFCHHVRGFQRAARGGRVRGEDDRIPRLYRDQRFGEDGRGGVGGGDQAGDHAHRPGDLIHPPGGILADDAHGLQVADALPDGSASQIRS